MFVVLDAAADSLPPWLAEGFARDELQGEPFVTSRGRRRVLYAEFAAGAVCRGRGRIVACTTAHPLHAEFPNKVGTSVSEATI